MSDNIISEAESVDDESLPRDTEEKDINQEMIDKENVTSPYSLDDIDPREKISAMAPLGDFAKEVFMMLEGVGAPEKKLILSPELQKAELVSLDDEETALIGKYTVEHIDDIGRHMNAVSTFPKINKPLFIEYHHKARFTYLPDTDKVESGLSVPEKIGLLVFRDPQDPKIINMFVTWKDIKGGLYHSYAIAIINEEILDDNASKLNLSKPFRERDIPSIIEASFAIVTENMKEEMFTVNELVAFNDPKREMALKETQKRALAEVPFFLATMIYLSSKDPYNYKFGFSNPFRKTIKDRLVVLWKKMMQKKPQEASHISEIEKVHEDEIIKNNEKH